MGATVLPRCSRRETSRSREFSYGMTDAVTHEQLSSSLATASKRLLPCRAVVLGPSLLLISAPGTVANGDRPPADFIRRRSRSCTRIGTSARAASRDDYALNLLVRCAA